MLYVIKRENDIVLYIHDVEVIHILLVSEVQFSVGDEEHSKFDSKNIVDIDNNRTMIYNISIISCVV